MDFPLALNLVVLEGLVGPFGRGRIQLSPTNLIAAQIARDFGPGVWMTAEAKAMCEAVLGPTGPWPLILTSSNGGPPVIVEFDPNDVQVLQSDPWGRPLVPCIISLETVRQQDPSAKILPPPAPARRTRSDVSG